MTNPIVEKVCTKCKELKPLEDFGAQKRKLDGKEAQCKTCVAEYRRNRWRANHVQGGQRAMHLWVKYKMRPEEYDALVIAQDGKCAICAQPPKPKEKYLSVDHCHETGLIRGLLCASCNVGLGNLGDTAERLEKALAYLLKCEAGDIPLQPAKVLKPHTQGKTHHWYGGTSLAPRGVDSPQSKLTEEAVRKILKDWATGTVTHGQLGKEHGVTSSTIQSITSRRNWKHVT